MGEKAAVDWVQRSLPLPLGFHTEGWGPWNFLPPEILKLSMVIIVVSMCCLESLSQIVSEAI